MTRDGLVDLRRVFLGFCGMPVMIFVALVVAAPGSGDMSPALGLLLVAAWSVVSHGLGRIIPPALVCDDAARLASSYRSRFFLQLACYESALLVGFVVAILAGEAWLYLVGAASMALGFARAYPSDAHLEQDQETLRDRGCNLSLVDALRGPAT